MPRPALRWRHGPTVACVAICLAVAPWCRAATQLQFDLWMRAVDRRSVSVQRAIAAGDEAAAIADAREIERLYGLMETYFQQDYPADDAAAWSRDARLLAARIPDALARHEVEQAARAARDIALGCNDCHDPYKPLPTR